MQSESLFEPPLTRAIKSGRVRLSPNEEVGEHTTEKREEILIIMKGVATLSIDGKSEELKEGETYYVEEGKKHNVMNKHAGELEYIYIVTMIDRL